MKRLNLCTVPVDAEAALTQATIMAALLIIAASLMDRPTFIPVGKGNR